MNIRYKVWRLYAFSSLSTATNLDVSKSVFKRQKNTISCGHSALEVIGEFDGVLVAKMPQATFSNLRYLCIPETHSYFNFSILPVHWKNFITMHTLDTMGIVYSNYVLKGLHSKL